jgi:hypothetical protein
MTRTGYGSRRGSSGGSWYGKAIVTRWRPEGLHLFFAASFLFFLEMQVYDNSVD